MADFTTTTNLSLKKPAIGGSSDKWGEYLNANLDTIDIEIQTLKTASSSRTLESLSNVLNLTPTTGQVLQYGIASWSATTLSIPEDVEDLSNVTVTSPSDGQVLAWSNSNSRWENQTPGAATIPNGSITSAKLSTSLQGQLNLILQTTGTPTDNQILRYDSTTANWQFEDLPGGTVSALSDTDVSSVANKDVLVYNSTSGEWVSRQLAIADISGLQAELDTKLETANITVSNISDTTITTTADDSFLVFDAADSRWKNEGPSTVRSTLGLVIGTNVQAYDADLTTLGGLAKTDGNFIVGNGTTWTVESGATARTSLGLGTLATQSTITESQISDLQSYITASSTDTLTNKAGNISQWTNDSGYLTAETNDLSAVTGTLAIANGGTGQTTAAAARVALLPTLGSAGQVLAVNTGTTDVEWVSVAGSGTVTSVAISGSDGIEVDSGSPITSSGTIALGINASTLSTYLGLGALAAQSTITESQISDFGSYQTSDAGLTSIAGLTTAADKMIYTTASDVYAVTTLTSAGRALLDDADASAQRTTLGLGTAATTASTEYATAAQGITADSAVQPGDNANTLGSGAATDGYVLMADGVGGAAWEAVSAGGGTDVTLAGSLDYLTISGQEITRNAIDLTTDITGTLPIASGGTGATTASAARIALGLEIGTDVQSYDADTTKNDVSNTFSANQIISVESASAALRITQTGAGNALVVEDTTNPDSTPFVINAVGQVGIGTDSPTEKFDVDGNINASGTLTLGTALAVAEGGTGVTALGSLDAADLGSGAATDGYVLTADGAGGAAWEQIDAADLGSGAATDGYVLTADGAGNAAWEAASGVSLPIELLSSGASIRKSDGTTAVLSESSGTVTLDNASISSAVVFPAGHVIQSASSYSTTSTQKTLSTSYSAINTSVTLSNLTVGNKVHIQYYINVDTEASAGAVYSTVYVDSTDNLAVSGDDGCARTQDAGSGRFIVQQIGFADFEATSSSHTFTIYCKKNTYGTIRDDFVRSKIVAMEIQA